MWAEMARIVGEAQPRFVFVENSPMLTSRGIGVVLGDLAVLGFNARWGVLGAGDVGALHERNRIWIVAYTNDRQERIQGVQSQAVSRESAFSWCQNVRRVADLGVRSNLSASGLCRNYDGLARAVDRIKAIGNGQVPAVAALAWEILSSKPAGGTL